MELEATFGHFFKIQVMLLLIELGQERKTFLLQRSGWKGLSKDGRGNSETHGSWISNVAATMGRPAEDVKEKDRRDEIFELRFAS